MTVFDTHALAKAVNAALLDAPDVPRDHRGAFVTVADAHGVTAVVAAKVGAHWQIQSVVTHDWAGKDLEAGVSVKASW